MHHRLHAGLALLLEVSGFLAGALAGRLLFGSPVDPGGMDWPAVGGLLGLILVGSVVPRVLWRKLVPARCPACGATAARLEGRHPWVYRCRACGHVHESAVSDGSSTRGDSDLGDD